MEFLDIATWKGERKTTVDTGSSPKEGWEEIVTNNVSHILKTSLAKSVKEQNCVLSMFKMDKDTSKLKKQIALMCERLNKGASLSTSDNTKLLEKERNERNQKNLSTLREEEPEYGGSSTLSNRLEESDDEAVRYAMENVKLYDGMPAGPLSDSDGSSDYR